MINGNQIIPTQAEWDEYFTSDEELEEIENKKWRKADEKVHAEQENF